MRMVSGVIIDADFSRAATGLFQVGIIMEYFL